jgi:hypothetical protein
MSQTDIASSLASSFALIYSSDRYDPAFRWIKENAERLYLNFTSHGEEPYNSAFTMTELLTSLKQSHNTSLHLDSTHNKMLSYLSPGAKACCSLHVQLYMEKTCFPSLGEKQL